MEKRKVIIVFIVLILIVIVGLWGSGIIPKRIARISASNYLEKNFPKMQLEYVDIEWSSSFGGYSIKFKDANNKTYSFIMNNKYFPISLGQGLFAFEEEYRQKYEWQDTNIENNEESYFYGKVIESNAKYIIVEPNENEEERKSADKISVGLGENNDALYTIGTNVKITYDGTILESYPAQVKATKIEIKSAENFEILFKDRQPIDSYNKIYAILDKSETDKYNYTIYAYDGSVNIKIDDKEYSLKVLGIERGNTKPRKDIAKWSDVKENIIYMYDDKFLNEEQEYPYQVINNQNDINKILDLYIEKYYNPEDDKQTWFNKIKELAGEMGYAEEVKEFKANPGMYKAHVGDVSTVLRIALTGRTNTPDMYEIMAVLGKTSMQKRFEKAKK